MNNPQDLNNSVIKDWSHPETDPRERYLSAIFMLAGMATTLIFLVSITI